MMRTMCERKDTPRTPVRRPEVDGYRASCQHPDDLRLPRARAAPK
jgi:hypothetical protein